MKPAGITALIVCAGIVVFFAAGPAMAAPPAGGYVKIWEDRFDAASLNSANWTVGLKDAGTNHMVPGAAGQYRLNTSYADYITAEDVVVQGGSLQLKAQKRSYTGTSPSGTFQYTSGWVMSMHKVHFNKGYVEFRAKFPSGDKVWPALWLISEDRIWGPEWDMWEYFGYRAGVGNGYDNMGMHLCYDEYPNQKWSEAWINSFDANKDCETWHTYGFEWTSTYAKWSIDGTVVRTLNNTIGASWPNEEMYFVLNNGVKSDSPDTTTTWPNQVEIDYVEVWQIPSVNLSVNSTSIAEASGSATVTATLTSAQASPVTVNLAYTGTATGSGTDYTTSATSIVMPAGSTTGTVVLTATQDSLSEGGETIIVDISSVSGALENGPQQVIVAIADDERSIPTWIVAGQSNAEGYGITTNPVPSLAPSTTLASISRSDLNKTHANVRFYQGINDYNSVTTSAGLAMSPKASWHAMTPYEGLAYDWNTGIGNESGRRFGSELAFGYEMQRRMGAEIAIIKYARGGASMASSTGAALGDGAYNDYDPSDSRMNQYDKLVTTISNAVTSLPAGDVLRLRGVLWMQGEGDANATMASSYQANLTEFIAALRSQLSIIASTSGGKLVPDTTWGNLKFHIGTIATPGTDGNAVRSAQAAVATADSNVITVNAATGLSMMTNDDWSGNGIHYDTAGQVLLGERFYGAVNSGFEAYETWRLNFQMYSNSGLSEDYDGDGFSNLLEYACNGNPTQKGGVSGLQSISATATTFQLTHTERSPADSSLVYTLETNSTLTGSWTPVTNATYVGETPAANGFKTITHQIPMAGPARFYRLKVVK